MLTLSPRDRHCRYLPAPEGKLGYGFGDFLSQVGVRLPNDIELLDMVRRGWIRPLLRIRIPSHYYMEWNDYPNHGRKRALAGEDTWADALRVRIAFPGVRQEHSFDLAGDWFKHFLDDPTNILAQEAWAHSIPAGPGIEEPEILVHPVRGERIAPWIDYFGYWQVYELIEVLHDLRLCGPVLDHQEVETDFLAVLKSLPLRRERSQHRIHSTREHWNSRARVFDWLSRFRTLLGRAGELHLPLSEIENGTRRLLAAQDLTTDDIKEGMRKVLLVEWERWLPSLNEESAMPRLLREHLRQDVLRAVEFLELVTGEEVDFGNSLWGRAPDRQNYGFTPLLDVLPFEAATAKWDFAAQAMVYIDSAPLLMTEERIESLVERWWRPSVPFRRFCVAFKRLHDQIINNNAFVDLRASSPMDFVTLCTLHAEKIFQDHHYSVHPGKALPRRNRDLFLSALRDVLVLTLGSNEESDRAIAELSTILRTRDQLHDLDANPRDPFLRETDFTLGDTVQRNILVSFGNLVILRNYVAHHDVLDRRIISESEMSFAALLAVLIPTLLVLEVSPSPPA
jgi:hypothetical protein